MIINYSNLPTKQKKQAMINNNNLYNYMKKEKFVLISNYSTLKSHKVIKQKNHSIPKPPWLSKPNTILSLK